MGTGASRSVPAAVLGIVGVVLALPVGSEASAASEPTPAVDVILTDVGPDWHLVTDEALPRGSHLREFARTDGATLSITGFAVARPPGVETLFRAQLSDAAGVESIAEPTFAYATWLVGTGGAPGDGGLSALMVASRDHLFTIIAIDGAGRDGPAFVRDVARRQVEAAGGEPPPADAASARDADDAELLPLLPDQAPAGLGHETMTLTISGGDELATAGVEVPEVAQFLDERAKNAARVWGSAELVLAVGITEYPFEIFAAAGLGQFVAQDVPRLAVPAGDLPPDAVTFRTVDAQQVGVAFRRGHLLYTVYAEWTAPGDEQRATALAVDLAAAVVERAPSGATGPYAFPSPPSRLAGSVLTGLLVVAAVAGTRAIAWWRARRIRRAWATIEPPAALPPPGSPGTHVVDLDADAAALRRRGVVVMVVQLLSVVTGVVALAGDFALVGVVVAAASLVAGLGFSRWWAGRELGLLGPDARPRALVLPRWPGALLGLVAFAVLGVGVAYLLKGIRYVTFKPTLAQLRWSELFGVAPRTVGLLFVAGGFAATVVGAILYRAARALARAGVRDVLVADSRPPALYLRSFDDDGLPLPTIASARRPLFELFSLRGADPFEESVAWELDTYAPVVAVGRPGGSLRSLGAAREHLAQETWRAEIADRMTQAGLIVLAPGETAGLAWELTEIVRGGHVSKTLFVFPPLAPPDLARRWEHTAELLRSAGTQVGVLGAPAGRVHTVRVGRRGELRATVAGTRDEATYRTAVDRSVAPVAPTVPERPISAAAVAGSA